MTTFNLNKIANLKEADYSKISSRVKAFCSTFETAQILTEIVKDELGHVIFKAHAVVDGTIKGTGHAHEVEGSSNANNTSHYEVCETIAVGRYRLLFQAGDYLQEQHGFAAADLFLDEVPLDFRVFDADKKYHVPLLLSPYGYSTYRGS